MTGALGARAAPLPRNRSPLTLAAAARRARSYRSTAKIPENVLDSMFAESELSPGFSIKGAAAEGAPIYLDMQATTPIDPRVLDAMMPYMLERRARPRRPSLSRRPSPSTPSPFPSSSSPPPPREPSTVALFLISAVARSYGNPHSKTHSYGWETEAAVEAARGEVARLVGASARELVFTSGATEANNMAVKGVARFYGKRKRHVITTQTEHKCVLDSCRALEQEGFDVTYLPVGRQTGLVDLAELAAALDARPDTALVSVMAVNNEIGTLQPLAEIGALCRARGAFFHTDAAQMLGKLPLDVDALNIDLMSLSSHKVYGPKGVGALYVRRRPRVRLSPLLSGGGQERGLRSGTLPHALCVGFGAACDVARVEMDRDRAWIGGLSRYMRDAIEDNIPEVTLNGDAQLRYDGCLNYSFAYVEGESLLMALKNIAVSSGSACTSASLEPSYVLRAIGVGEELAHTSIRFGIGRFTTRAEVDHTIGLLRTHVERLREMSPLWELVQEGVDLSTIQWTQDAAHGHHH